MPRPPTPVGTYGEISTRKLAPKKWEARARFRMADGTSKQVRRVDSSREASKTRLREAMTRLSTEVRGGEISPDTRVAKIAGLWFEELQREATLADRSPNTVRIYRSHLNNWVLPAVGELQARELTVTACDRLVKRVHDTKSYETAKSVRAVLSSVCGYGVRHGAMGANPVRSVGRLASNGNGKEVVALTLEQRADLLAQVERLAEEKQTDTLGRSLGARGQVWSALPDLVRCMLATGVRLGELLALTAGDVDVSERTVTVAFHLVRIEGQGLVRVPNRKGNSTGLVLKVPEWSVSMWRQRRSGSADDPLFPSWSGGWLDPSNVINRISEVMDDAGYGWVTSHVFRKTVATVLDEANLPTSAIADQLGNTQRVADKHYRKRRAANDASAAALERMVTEDDER